ncbi:MAG: hypothetical protein K2X74_11980 [Acetobacteraceae bacterium]|nr:hypothetical protein [Acetobacteraceae bacterium]
METLTALADHSIRRACGFAGLGIATTMLAFSFDLPLAFRTAGAMTAVLCLGLLWAAWRAPRRDLRRSELWALLPGTTAEFARTLPRGEAQRLLAGVLRRRLIWHAERVGLAALGFWGLAMLAWLLAAARG